MLAWSDNLSQSFDALKAHKLRAALTTLGLTMGVTTLITVMTIVQGANVYVEQKIANLGTNVFRIARTPFTVTDFGQVIKALRYKKIELDDAKAVEVSCKACEQVGASANSTARVRFGDRELKDITIIGHTANMVDIDTRTILLGRYFSPTEDERAAKVVLIGDYIVREFFTGTDPIGKSVRIGDAEYLVVGTFEKIGSVLGQDQDNFAIVPMGAYLQTRGGHTAVTINVKASGGEQVFEQSMDQSRLALRSRRHVRPGAEDDFFIATSDSYIELWNQISGAFFAVFIMVSSISAVVGGIVIMNVMLVSVTERTKEIGVRRAMGATQADIRTQFITESVVQCIFGGIVGVFAGFGAALALRQFTDFPAAVETWVAILGVVLSSAIGMFFGIYPAIRASQLDPVVALRAD